MDILTSIPVVTRTYLLACTATTLATSLKFVQPVRLFLHFPLVFGYRQYWRLLTNFTYFAPSFGLGFFFNMFFFVRQSSALETESFRRRRADFVVMWLFGIVGLLLSDYAVWRFAPKVFMPFLGPSLSYMLVYVWARRNPDVRMNFLGLFNFRAPYLPYVLLGFGMMLGNSPLHDAFGIAVGHLYYFLEDVYPQLNGGIHLIRTPNFMKRLLDPVDEIVVPPVDIDGDDQQQQQEEHLD